jgi:hypothetical protein
MGHSLFGPLDLIHVAAAIVLIGAIITDFDSPSHGERYFDSVDEGGWQGGQEPISAPTGRAHLQELDHSQAGGARVDDAGWRGLHPQSTTGGHRLLGRQARSGVGVGRASAD